MGSTAEDEEVTKIDRKLSQTFSPLKSLERVGSSESVQLWIDSLTDDDWKGSNEEITGLYEHGVADYGNIELLLVPGTGDDDLMLGADAKSLSFEESEHGFSPRLSPLLIADNDGDVAKGHYSNNNISCLEGAGVEKKGAEVEQVDEDDRRIDESRNSSNTKQSELLEYETEGRKITHQDSLKSLPSISSLFVAMEADPEDMLISLGFCNDGPSQSRRIPRRFFINPSQAKGIDVQEFLRCYVNIDESPGMVMNAEGLGRESLSKRFSESSIDLSQVDYGDDIFAKFRRAKFQDTSIPVITVSEENSDDDVINEKNSQTRLSGHLRLSTVLEEYEPRSRASSISRSFSGEKKKSLQKQDRVDIGEDNEFIGSALNSTSVDKGKNENQNEHSAPVIESKRDQQGNEELLCINIASEEPDVFLSDDNNNCDFEYVQKIPTFTSYQDKLDKQELNQDSILHDNINKMSIAMAFGNSEGKVELEGNSEGKVELEGNSEGKVELEGNSEGKVELEFDLLSCKDAAPLEEDRIEIESVKEDNETERVLTNSECSYPDSIEDTVASKPNPLLDMNTENGEIARRFSNDSLQSSLSEHESRCDSIEGSEEESTKENNEFTLEDENSQGLAPSRIVYRSLGRIENLKNDKEDIERAKEALLTGSSDPLKSKKERIVKSFFPFLSNETKPADRTRDFSQSCFVESAPRKRSSMSIRDYFRKLANRRTKRFFSLESLNTVEEKEKYQSDKDCLFPNTSAFADTHKTMNEKNTHSSFSLRKHSDGELDVYQKSNYENGKQVKKFLDLEAFSLKGNSKPELSGKENFENGTCNSSFNSFTVNNGRHEERLKQSSGKIFQKMNGHSFGLGINNEGGPNRKNGKTTFITGCSIESSGFEEENGICRSSTERCCRWHQSSADVMYHQLCEDCKRKNGKQTISETSLSISAHDDKSCMDLRNVSLMDQNSDLTKGRFDYLILQVTSLREEISEQEERLKRYIDESMENIKTSILTEISILDASHKTRSSKLSLEDLKSPKYRSVAED